MHDVGARPRRPPRRLRWSGRDRGGGGGLDPLAGRHGGGDEHLPALPRSVLRPARRRGTV
ncbi:hypothetical protein ACFFX0_19360 [Citricoccus parietis]|uniref:Uncharacterized protein n=1 Tax=Citricoccus parietis TaxID=592307 RepID=A0ABV5G2S3_9MICC